jgi:hypothetical protein
LVVEDAWEAMAKSFPPEQPAVLLARFGRQNVAR